MKSLTVRLMGMTLAVLALVAPAAVGFIHFPPMTMPKMCKISSHIRVLKVKKFDKDKGVVIFEAAETLKKGPESPVKPVRHVLRADADGAKPVRDWLAEGKTAVMFSIEGLVAGTGPGVMGCAYVFIDDYCYSLDYNEKGEYWSFLRGEPALSACYHGPAEPLPALVRDILAGKDVQVPVKEPEKKEDANKRINQITELLKENRVIKP